MPIAATQTRYSTVAMTLHWLIALAVIANIALGLYFPDLPRSDPNKFALMQLHKSIGLTVLVLSLARLGWRLMNPVPPLPADMPVILKWVAHATHFLLYFLIIAIPLSGWLLVSSSPLGLPTMYFGVIEWPNLPGFADLTREAKRPLSHEFGAVHSFLAWSAIVLIPLHIGGALYHQFIRRDNLILRMLPGGKAEKIA